MNIVEKVADCFIENSYVVTEKMFIASKACFGRVLAYLANDSEIKICRAVASNPHCSILVLEQLLVNNDSNIHHAILNHSHSSDFLKHTVKFILSLEAASTKLLSELANSKY